MGDRLGEEPCHFAREGRDVAWVAAGHQLPVHHDFLLAPAVSAPSSSRATRGSVSSTCSNPSATRMAIPFPLSFLMEFIAPSGERMVHRSCPFPPGAPP